MSSHVAATTRNSYGVVDATTDGPFGLGDMASQPEYSFSVASVDTTYLDVVLDTLQG